MVRTDVFGTCLGAAEPHRPLWGIMAGCTLTFLWPGVVLPKGMVFVNVGVQVLQGILWDILSSHHFVIADNVGESNS